MKNLYPEIQTFINSLETHTISEEREEILKQLASHIRNKMAKSESVELIFICTHNSRRSQLCQVWARTAAISHGFGEVRAYSGGTEATAFHPSAIRVLENSGFRISKKETGSNPVYAVLSSPQEDSEPYFSKVYDDEHNPATSYLAVLTCADAEANCPFIPEAEVRFSLKYDDPKKADDTAGEREAYAETNRLIATEMYYLFSKI